MTTQPALPAEAQAFDHMRSAMVSGQLRINAVADPRVIAAMARIPRERYVPAFQISLAYRDTSLPLTATRRLNPPLATARLMNEARLRTTDRVLLIGAALGYAAAVLAEMVAQVVAVEDDPALVDDAARALAGVSGVVFHHGALYDGARDHAPFDVLMIDGAVERVPDALAAQVCHGGRIVTGLVDRGVTRLAVGVRSGTGVVLTDFADSDCAMLPGFAATQGFRF